ncbi:hypothetical protein OG552_17295 [Streptomyces sp. NBC_01476]|uniref:hypothetical protein n=1 Tax=Streptomyces sp. NBC_01476 TaxID=2903881 RepID=UPI002E3686A6|nr:hypothetical protein [Streptomyces sp. NBC_01476]
MDRDEARRAAVAHFTDDGTKHAGWTITGPISQDVTTPEGARSTLVFKFRPPAGDAYSRRSAPQSVGVDPATGVAAAL